MKPASKLSGKRFERLLVTERVYPNRNGNTVWHCLCDCGGEVVVMAVSLIQGRTRSCGCLQRERTSAAARTHGLSKTPTYRVWAGMLKRCYNTSDKSYPYYGGKGIRVCATWRQSFESFLADMGERPAGTTIDRIDNGGNYEPGNCRWTTRKRQRRNTSANIVVELEGRPMSLADACEILRINHHNTYMRMRRGASFLEAIS